jgi:hypothetical protein
LFFFLFIINSTSKEKIEWSGKSEFSLRKYFSSHLCF